MHFKKLFFGSVLLFLILSMLSFSNCTPSPPPDPGIFEIQLTTVDTSNQPLPHTLIGLFGEVVNDNYFGPHGACLIDTFYTNHLGFAQRNYVTSKYNSLWLTIMPNHHSTPDAQIQNHQLDTTLVLQPLLPLLSLNINIRDYDSVIVETIDLPYYFNKCVDVATNLADIPFSLNNRKVTSDTNIVLDVVPRQPASLEIHNYSNGAIVKDSFANVSFGGSVVEVQIN